MSFLADRAGEPWEGGGVPVWLVLDLGEKAREAVRRVPAVALVAAWCEPWLSRGVEPPRRTVTELRGELEQRVREALRDAPRTALRPISEAAFELGIPERTLRAQIMRGALRTERNGRGQLVFELPVRRSIRVKLVASAPPDPRVLLLMSQERCEPGEEHRLGYRRRRDGENWREVW